MLLGECPYNPPGSGSSSSTAATTKGKDAAASTNRGFDILHATSTALIDALREVLVDSDFENAMKAVTSWVPVKDEDMLMRVAKAEWKKHQSRIKRS
jgi:hypothetical protein